MRDGSFHARSSLRKKKKRREEKEKRDVYCDYYYLLFMMMWRTRTPPTMDNTRVSISNLTIVQMR
jgi:hypothetical protein